MPCALAFLKAYEVMATIGRRGSPGSPGEYNHWQEALVENFAEENHELKAELEDLKSKQAQLALDFKALKVCYYDL